MSVIGRDDLGNDPALENNVGRVAQVEMIDTAISQWTAEHDLEDVLDALNARQIPAGRIYDVADIAADPHYQARGMIMDSTLPDGTAIKLPGIVPKLSATPGEVRSPAPALGQHTDEVLSGLGIDEDTRKAWRQRGII
jgi:formyl-CoA transferase